MPQCRKCKKLFPNHVKINGKKANLQKRKFCLDCSPFNSHNTQKSIKEPTEYRTCGECKNEKDKKDFYVQKNKNGREKIQYICKFCNNYLSKLRRINIKKQAVEYKGGKCEICEYNKYLAALEFHHLDPSQKDFTISTKGKKGFESIKNELDKCQLLCCRCHREEHEKLKILLEGIEPSSTL